MLNQKSIFSPIASTSQTELNPIYSDTIQDNFDLLVAFYPVWAKAKKNEIEFFTSSLNKDKEIYQLINADNLSSIELENLISLVKAQMEIEQKQLNVEQEKLQETTQTLVNIRRYQQFIGDPSDSFIFFFNIFVFTWGMSVALQAYIDPEEF